MRTGRAGRPRLLLTNDDGIGSPGLQLLARRLAESHELVVVAPRDDRSGSGTAIGLFDPREGVELKEVELAGLEAYTVAGPPGLAVMAGVLGAFGRRPDLVISGINAGMNTGLTVLHSGTVGAALIAGAVGIDGLALSLVPSVPWHWESAIAAAESVVDWLLARDGPPLVLNVNVPAAPLSEVRGARWAGLDRHGHFRAARADATSGRVCFEVGAPAAGHEVGADSALCRAGFVTLTPLSTVEASPFPEIPAEDVCALRRRG